MDDDPAGRRRDCVGDRARQPFGDERPPGAARPAVLDTSSAPVLRFGFRRILEYQPFEVRGHAAVLLAGLLSEDRLEFGGPPDGNRLWLVQRWNSPVVLR